MSTDNHALGQVIAIAGGGTVGSEAASIAASKGALVLVFEQAVRPYGELEDRVPSWHLALAGGQLGRIDENLAHPNIHFIPKTRLGREVSLAELAELGVHAVLVASGRGRERQLALADGARLAGRGLIDHGALLHWFNRRGDFGYPGPALDVPDGAVVIGQGLEAVDAARILNTTIYLAALAKRGITLGPEQLLREGLAQTLARRGLSPQALGLRGVTLAWSGALEAFMPGVSGRYREELIDALRKRDLIELLPGVTPLRALERDGRLCGLVFARGDAELELATDLVVSALGSEPDPFEAGSSTPEVVQIEAPLASAGDNLMERILSARLAPPREDTLAIREGEALAEMIGDALRVALEPSLKRALGAGPNDTASLERVRAWAAARQQAVGFSDYSEWISASRSQWLG